MGLDAAEKMFYKVVLKNKLLAEDQLKEFVAEMDSSPHSLPQIIKKSGALKPAVLKKIVDAVENKGQIFTKSLFGSEEDEETNEIEEPSTPAPLEELSLDNSKDTNDSPELNIQTGAAPIISSFGSPAAKTQSSFDDDEFTIDLPEANAETITQPIIVGQKVTLIEKEDSEEQPEIVYEQEDTGLIQTPIIEPEGLGLQLVKLLEFAEKQGASDLHISVNSMPFIRKGGLIIKLKQKELSEGQVEKMLFGILTKDQTIKLKRDLAIDLCLDIGTGTRYRVNIIRQRIGWDGTFRIIPSEIPSFEELQLPPAVKRLTEYHQGLVLVTGPKGCGKTTTMAAMIDLINSTREDHIITVEDPIEYIFKSKGCQVTQRALGSHTMSYSNALRGALREDPDIIMVGELRDLDTISSAITAAETGHLVLASLHTTSAVRTVDRLIDSFPPDQQAQIRVMLAESIKGVICQQLLPKADGSGAALALEVLVNNISVRKMIVDSKTFQIDSAMQTGKKEGMLRMDQSIKDLYEAGTITADVAKEFAREPSRLGVE